MLSGRRKDEPDDQLVFCSGLALSRLKTSTNPARRRCPPSGKPFSTRTSRIVTVVHAARADRLCQDPNAAVVARRHKRAPKRLPGLVAQERGDPDVPGTGVCAVNPGRPDPELVAPILPALIRSFGVSG